jgi:hypothetical protein
MPIPKKRFAKVPAVAQHRLIVPPGDVGVLGYLGDRVQAIINRSGVPVRCSFAVSPTDCRALLLGNDELYPVQIDADTCIRQRFMPHIVESCGAQTIALDVLWYYDGSHA